MRKSTTAQRTSEEHKTETKLPVGEQTFDFRFEAFSSLLAVWFYCLKHQPTGYQSRTLSAERKVWQATTTTWTSVQIPSKI